MAILKTTVLISVCLLSFVQSREIKRSTSSESPNESERDYYSDIDEEYERKIENIRTVENWISLGVLAISLVISLLIIITLVHLKSRKESQLESLL